MDTNLIPAMAGVLGSLAGGSATVATAWITQRTLTRRELNVRDMRQREKLYADFIAECAKLLLDAFTHTLEDPEKLLGLYALTNRIRLTASQPVLAEAERLLTHITDQYFARNLTLQEMRQLAHSAGADPLKGFGEACRAELKSIRGRL
jgi:hypothetical protein